MKAVAFLIAGLILGIALFGYSGYQSRQYDLQDGGDAQVIRVEPPAAGIDQNFANVYKTIAQGNKANAEGDATTTVANATARQMDSGSLLSWVIGGLLVGVVLLIAINIKVQQ